MGGGASKYVGENEKEVHDEVPQSTDVVPNGTLFKPRPSPQNSTIAGMNKSFSERWNFSGEDQFNVAALKLLSDLLQKETVSEKEKLASFEQWLDDKSSACFINIQSKHVNAVSLSIEQQRELPDDCLMLLDTYLEALPSNFNAVGRINAVSDMHAKELKIFAEQYDFVHHDLEHALEIESRTMNQAKALKIWPEETPRDAFLRAITGCMIRLHDHKKSVGFILAKSGESDEEITAKRVILWLNTVLNIPDEVTATDEQNCVRHMIQFMAHRIIVCGTTMIYSKKRTLDLIELLFVLEQAAADVEVSLSSKSNQSFIEQVNIMTILAGQNDKNPGASLLNVLEQLKRPSLATLPLLKRYYGNILVLDTFFLSPQFKAYYDPDRLREHYYAGGFDHNYDERDFFELLNKQAFLMMVVPHISMCLESAKSKVLHRFIQVCRANLALDPDVFKDEFEALFVEYDVSEQMNRLFFEKLGAEAAFSTSQEGGLSEMANINLPGMGVKRAELVYSLIDPNVPLQDAMNLNALQLFYDGLAPAHGISLCKTLMMTVVVQAGAMKARELGLVDLHKNKPTSHLTCSI